MPINPDGSYAPQKVTAKAIVSYRVDTEWGDVAVSQLTFMADYADDRNKEWAAATPALSLQMTVKREIADAHFGLGRHLTLTFESAASGPRSGKDEMAKANAELAEKLATSE